jgi:hypothetical protein
MTRVVLAALILFRSVAPADAQPPASSSDLVIYFRGYVTAITGPETASGVTFDAEAIVGKTVTGAMSTMRCGYFAASSNNGALDDADVGWRLEITPTRVVDRTVTFRLRWTRAVDRLSSGASTPPGGDTELTLKLGESRQLDEVAVAREAKTFDGKPCDRSRATLRVGIDPYPFEQFDRRLIATDVWLVERLADGKERTQLLPLRSIPNRSTSFYFDSLRAGDSSLDIFGHLMARLEGDTVELDLETISRWDAKAPVYPYRWVKSTLRVLPNEVIDVPLPKLGSEAGVFADRIISLRIRARQLR